MQYKTKGDTMRTIRKLHAGETDTSENAEIDVKMIMNWI